MRPDLLIFDFDGVIADSETLANALLAEALSTDGLSTSTEDAMRRYMGRRWSDALAQIAKDFGGTIPDGFETRLKAVTRPRMRAEVGPVAGVGAFIRAHHATPQCVASSSSPEWLADMTRKFGFDTHFGDNLFSATLVSHGKPAPDVFLYAAREMSVSPGSRCVVIEDSPAGIKGANAAGMTAIGFCGASHIRDGHADTLRDAGADGIAYAWTDVARLIDQL
jgi:HAD superfamily hydrolase (TIGR01509 family)